MYATIRDVGNGNRQPVIILHADGHAHWVRMAIEFASRGPTVRVTATTDLSAVDPALQVLDLTGTSRSPTRWRLTDSLGRDILAGEAAAEAVAFGRGTLQVQIRCGSQVLRTGNVKVRRRVAGTIASAMEALGPLLMLAAVAPLATKGQQGTGNAASRRRAEVVAVMRTAAQAARAVVTARRWSVARWPGSLDSLIEAPGPLRTLRWFGPRASAFWADPHVVVHEGREWLFVEELDRATGLGSIRATEFVDGELIGREVVLRSEHHLSFPQIYHVADRWLATVETCEAHNPIYTFERPGTPWRIATDLPTLPPHLADPVLFFDEDGRLTQAWGSDGLLDPNAVFVRYDRFGEDWVRTDAATEVDVTRSRNGGDIDVNRGLRAVQDCGESYGAAAELLDLDGRRVVRLTPQDVGRGSDHRRRKGVHTITWDAAGDAVWIDSWYRRPSLVGALLRLREQRHSRQCTG
jgi:hypothetical protein